MTLDEIRASDKVMLNAVDIAEILGTDAHSIRIMAHKNPTALGFPVTICGDKGRRVRIPRLPFLKFLGVDD